MEAEEFNKLKARIKALEIMVCTNMLADALKSTTNLRAFVGARTSILEAVANVAATADEPDPHLHLALRKLSMLVSGFAEIFPDVAGENSTRQ